MKPRHPNPSEGIYWYALAVLAGVVTAALVYQNRRAESNRTSEFAATAAVVRKIDTLDDDAKSQIRYSILNRTNLEEAITKMGLSAAGGIDEDLEAVEPESAEALIHELDVEVTPRTQPGWCRIAITCTDPHRPERAICIANYLAQHYASVSQAAWRARVKSDHAAAVADTTAAHKAWTEAKSELIGFVEGHFTTLAKKPKPPEKRLPEKRSPEIGSEPFPAPAPALELVGPGRKKPDAAETAADESDAERLEQLRRRLLLLEERRDELSETLTPAHPDLIAVDDEITMVEKRVKLLRDKTVAPAQETAAEKGPAVSKKASAAAAGVVPEVAPADLAKHRSQFDTHRATVAKLEEEYHRALKRERTLAAASSGKDPIEVHLALGCQVVAAPGGLSFSGIFVAVLAGAVVGLGVILLGRSRTLFRRITTPEEAAAALGVPVAGVVPPLHRRHAPPRRRSTTPPRLLRRRTPRRGRRFRLGYDRGGVLAERRPDCDRVIAERIGFLEE